MVKKSLYMHSNKTMSVSFDISILVTIIGVKPM